MSQRGYQGGPPNEYDEGYGQGQQGKRPWRNNPEQTQGYGQSEGGYYGDDQHYLEEPGRVPQQSQGYSQEYEDPYYYQQEERQGWTQQDYQGSMGDQYQGQHHHHQQDFNQKGKYSNQKLQQQQPKPFKKQYPQPKKYQQEHANYTKPGYSAPSIHDRLGSYAEVDPERERGHHQNPKFASTMQKSAALVDRQDSSRKGSSMAESHQPGIQGGHQHNGPKSFGEYYTQKRYQEQELLKQSQQAVKNPTELTESHTPSDQTTGHPQIGGKPHGNTKTSIQVPEVHDLLKSKDTLSTPALQSEMQDERFAKTMSKFNTLDRGTFFVEEKNKLANFVVAGRGDLLAWKDTFIINGYLLHGVILKLMTLTSRVFLFVENLHAIYKKFIVIDEDGETVRWSDSIPDENLIATITSIEKVEVLDNDEDGFEGFVCYTICEDSTIEFNHTAQDVEDWVYVQDLILLYEPTSIRKIYLDVVYNTIYKPESRGFTGKRIAAIVNPHVPGETIQYKKKLVKALDKQCVMGSIWTQNGMYTLIAETIDDMERLVKLIDLALDVAEELNAYVMITNLRRTFDFVGKTILYISSDPTLKLIRSSNPISFANKIKKSEDLN